MYIFVIQCARIHILIYFFWLFSLIWFDLILLTLYLDRNTSWKPVLKLSSNSNMVTFPRFFCKFHTFSLVIFNLVKMLSILFIKRAGCVIYAKWRKKSEKFARENCQSLVTVRYQQRCYSIEMNVKFVVKFPVSVGSIFLFFFQKRKLGFDVFNFFRKKNWIKIDVCFCLKRIY